VIPKVIHRIWVGGPMPQIYKNYEKKWLDLNPGWSVKTWGDGDFGWLDNQDLFDRAEEYAPADGVGQFKSDVARYEILNRFGGVYVDCDVEPLKKFDPLLGPEGFAGWEVDNEFVGNTVLGSAPGNPFFAAMIEAARDGAKANKGRAVTWMTGPRTLTRLYGQWQDKKNLHVYPQKYFFPYSYSDLKKNANPELKDYPEAYSVHHWGHQRELRGRPLAGSGNGNLSVSIMAHEKRQAWVPDLEAQFPGVTTVWDRKNDRWDTGARALTAHNGKSQWHMVVQDDALLPPDFYEGVRKMLKYVPPNHPVGLYYGRVRPREQETYGLMVKAKRENASFIVHNGPWWGVGIVIPTAHIPALAQWGDANQQIPNYDRRIARWYYKQDIPCYYTVPSLIEHRTQDNPSLVAGRTGQNRRAWTFVGPRSALEVDWSGPVVRGGM
jgi:hypothetical protein